MGWFSGEPKPLGFPGTSSKPLPSARLLQVSAGSSGHLSRAKDQLFCSTATQGTSDAGLGGNGGGYEKKIPPNKNLQEEMSWKSKGTITPNASFSRKFGLVQALLGDHAS